MIDATNAALEQAPESFDGVGVDVSNDIAHRAMVNPPMVVATLHVGDSVIGRRFVGEHGSLRQDAVPHDSKHCPSALVGRCHSGDSSFAFHNANDASFLGIAW